MESPEHTQLLDLPDELLIRCLAGAGGMGIGAAAISCERLRNVAQRLHMLPVFSSALSTHQNLQAAIKAAAQRALSGCFGPVDFAVLFVANYGGNVRGKKKYIDQTDLTHAVDMLREVLGQDVAVVGCACSGIMGVGPDSQPIEVDPTCSAPLGRAAAAARKKKAAAAAAAAAAAGGSCGSSGGGLHQQLLPPLPPLPTKGVAVLLGKMPPGCVARTFAQEVVSGPPVPREPDSPTPPASWRWPFMNDVLALSNTQQQHLRQQLQQQPMPTTTTAGAAAGAGRGVSSATDVPGAAAEAAAAMELGASSPDTAAAAEGLMSVVAAAAAAAAAGDAAGDDAAAAASGGPDAAAAGAAAGNSDGVELVPQLCFLLYDKSLHSFGYTASEEMERALRYMAARGIAVVGGASSGAGDLFYSPGANGSRLLGDPPAHPQLVGLMLCTAKASLAANPQQQPAAAAAAAAAGNNNNSNSTAQIISSDSALRSVAYASMGLGPAEGVVPLFTTARARLVSRHAQSGNNVAVRFNVEACTPVYNNQQQRAATTTTTTTTAAAAAAAAAEAAAAAAGDGGGGSGGDEGGSGPTSAAGTTAADAAPVRRSARLVAGASSSSQQQQQQQQQRGPMVPPSFGLTPLEQLFACLLSALPDADSEDEETDEEEARPCLAVWEVDEEGGGSGCGGSAAVAAAGFTGDEKQVAVCNLLNADLSHTTTTNNKRTDVVEVTVSVHVSGYAVLKQLLNKPHHSLCMQVVDTKGAACARSVRRGVAQLLPLIHHNTRQTAPQQAQLPPQPPPPLPLPAAGAAGAADAQQAAMSGGCPPSASADYYAALAKCAAASGARSGLQALTVCSCTGRGQDLYCGAPGAAAAAGLLEGGQVVASSGAGGVIEGREGQYGDVCEAKIIDCVSGGSVPFVGVYVDGELGPEVQHLCTGWCKPLAGHSSSGGGEGSRQVGVAEMQGFTSMFAAWGCRPGTA